MKKLLPLIQGLGEISTRDIAALCLIVVILSGMADYFTGTQVVVLILYLIPVAISAWYMGWAGLLLISMACALSWWLAKYLPGELPTLLTGTWNIAAMLGLFALVGWLVARLKFEIEQKKTWAGIDYLTRVLNRRAFEEESQAILDLAVRYRHPLTIAYLDLDNFKTVNDTWGHAEGDRLLRAIGKSLRDSVRRSDLVARMGGDEFVIWLPMTDQEGATPILVRLTDNLEHAIHQGGWPVTSSIGAVTFPTPPSTVAEGISEADRLMYKAKRAGKNQVVHEVISG